MAKNPKPVEPDTDSGDSSEHERTPMTQATPFSEFGSQPEHEEEEEEEDSESDSYPTPKSGNGPRKTRSMLASAGDPEEFSRKSRSKPAHAGKRDEPVKSRTGARKTRSVVTSVEDPGKSSRKSRSKPAVSGKRDEPGKSNDAARNPRSEPVSDGKRTEVENGTDGEKLMEKKTTTLRVWSEDDVIVILKGMIDYSEKKKADPVVELDAFLHFIKKDLNVDVTRRQLQDKIRKLKGKYETNKNKSREMNPHEEMVYQLSESIWGKKRRGSETAFPVPKRAKSSLEEMVMAMGDKMFENGEGAETWNKLKLEDMENYLQHLEVEARQTKLVIDRWKSVGF